MKHLLYSWPSAGHLVINKIDVISKEVAATFSSATASMCQGQAAGITGTLIGLLILKRSVQPATSGERRIHFSADRASQRPARPVTLFLSAFDCMNKTGLEVCGQGERRVWI